MANHVYDKSRFLRGAPVDEAKIECETAIEPGQSGADAVPLRWLRAKRLLRCCSSFLRSPFCSEMACRAA